MRRAGAEWGWVIGFLTLGKGWVVQFSAIHRGWVILFRNRNRETFVFQPTVQTSLETESSIRAFSEKYVADYLLVKYMHHPAYINMMTQKRERKSNLTYMYEDVRSRKFYCEDVLKKKMVSVLYLFFTFRQPKRNRRKKKKKLDLVSTHISLSAAIGRVSTSKDTAGCESSAVSSSESSEAWEASKYCVLEEAGSDTSDNNKTQNWLQAVGVAVIAMYHF